jgi:hypoxanthine-DNA glycosylase
VIARAAAFAPIVDARVRVLVLGSLPGAESLRRRQYYAHPQNAFWRLIGAVAGRDLAALPYPARLAALLEARIGLWDVIATAERPGSLDAAIREAEHADLPRLVAGLPELRAVGFNGRTAAKVGRRLLAALPDRPALLDLPSSSPAYAGMPFAEKRARWAALARHLAD